MKKLIFFGLAMLMLISSCENKKAYRPSQFPNERNKHNFSFAIPYSMKKNSIVVRVRLNNGPQFEGVWDSGCSLPLKISKLEAEALVKNGTLSISDYKSNYPVTISFVDQEGVEHMLSNIQAVIDDNVGTDILIGLPVMQALGDSYEISQYDQSIYFKE